MSVVRANSLVAQVHAAVRAEIAHGRHPAGSALNIAETAKRLDVSATPVREAFARLAAEGSLRFHDNVGYRVPEPPTAKDYTDWALARVVVESSALQHILGPLDTRLLDEAEAINDELRDTSFGTGEAGIRRYSALNWRFHAQLIALARNATLCDLHARLYAAPQFSRIFVGRGIVNQARVVAEHRAILAALRCGATAAAADAMRRHIIDSLERDARMGAVSLSLDRLAPKARTRAKTGQHLEE